VESAFQWEKLGGEKQVVLLKNGSYEIRLAVLSLNNGKAITIFNGMKAVLSHYDVWAKIK
jgi:hypothetical protein